MRVEIREAKRGVHDEVRKLAAAEGCTLRAPHWSVSQAGLIGELAIAAGGVLMLDEVDEFRLSALSALRNTLEMMDPKVRPILFVTHLLPLKEPVRRLLDGLAALPERADQKEDFL